MRLREPLLLKIGAGAYESKDKRFQAVRVQHRLWNLFDRRFQSKQPCESLYDAELWIEDILQREKAVEEQRRVNGPREVF
jgi:hypothetical protein